MVQPRSTHRPSGLARVWALVLLLGAAPAVASWATASVEGVPTDVQVWGPRTFTVATTMQVAIFDVDDSTSPPTVVRRFSQGPGAVSTWLGPGGCFAWVEGLGNLGSNGSCTPPVSGPLASGFVPNRMRLNPAGAGYALGFVGGTPRQLYSALGLSSTPWSTASLSNAPPTRTLATLRLANANEAVLGFFSGRVVWARDGALVREHLLGDTVQPRALALQSAAPIGSPDMYALVGTNSNTSPSVGSLFLLRLLPDLSVVPEALVLPASYTEVSGVDLNVDPGSARGRGFGMAVALRDNVATVLRAMPATSPAALGRQWLVTSVPPPLTQWLDEVSCFGATLCVISRSDRLPGEPNLLIYLNQSAPSLQLPQVELLEGQSDQRFSITATDADGDAVHLSLEPSTESSGAVFMSSQRVAGGLQLTFQAGAVCQDTQWSVVPRVHASDGLAANDRAEDLQVRVRHTVPPLAPSVTPPSPVVSAGGSALTLQATGRPTAAGCLPTGFAWQGVTPELAVSGGTATFTPPPTVCEATGRRYTYQVRGTDSAGSSPPSEVTVVVQPWGVPLAPFSAGAEVVVPAGQRTLLARQQTHACEGSAGFPGVETEWRLEGTPPADVRVVGEDGSTTGPWRGRVWVEPAACVQRELRLVASNRTLDAAGYVGPESTLTVRVRPQLAPTSAIGLRLTDLRGSNASELVVGAQAQVECAELYTGLSVRYRLEREGGELVAESGPIPLGQQWRQPLPQGCMGGRFRVLGTLVDEQGNTGGSHELQVSTPQEPLALAPLPEEVRLVARCGSGAQGTLTQALSGLECPGATLSWEQVGGPAVDMSAQGREVELVTREKGLQELVGQSVVLRVRAEAGGGNVAERQHVVHIAVEPFVSLSHQAEVPASSDTGLVGMSARLSNTTGCAVGGLELRQRLEGLVYMPGSARYEGRPVEVEWAEEQLVIRGVELGARGQGTLTYVARPRLLGEGLAQGEVLLNGEPVSLPAGSQPPSSCGCSPGGSAGGSGSAVLGLLLLAAALRSARWPRPAPARSSHQSSSAAPPA